MYKYKQRSAHTLLQDTDAKNTARNLEKTKDANFRKASLDTRYRRSASGKGSQ